LRNSQPELIADDGQGVSTSGASYKPGPDPIGKRISGPGLQERTTHPTDNSVMHQKTCFEGVLIFMKQAPVPAKQQEKEESPAIVQTRSADGSPEPSQAACRCKSFQ